MHSFYFPNYPTTETRKSISQNMFFFVVPPFIKSVNYPSNAEKQLISGEREYNMYTSITPLSLKITHRFEVVAENNVHSLSKICMNIVKKFVLKITTPPYLQICIESKEFV